MLIDTHCHLTDEAFASDVAEVIQRAEAREVDRMVLACVDEQDAQAIIRLAQQYPTQCIPTIGIHPENIASYVDKQLSDTLYILERHATEMRAIGEVGLDLHWDASRLEEQRRVLKTQMKWSDRFGLPLLLHIRDAMPQWLELLAEWRTTHQAPLRGIMHCYSGTAEQAFEILQSGTFYFGIGGTLTYKKSLVPDVARAIGLEHLVVETDAPYLAPVPHRGQRNEPSFVADTASALATIFGTTIEEVARITTENAQKLFAK